MQIVKKKKKKKLSKNKRRTWYLRELIEWYLTKKHLLVAKKEEKLRENMETLKLIFDINIDFYTSIITSVRLKTVMYSAVKSCIIFTNEICHLCGHSTLRDYTFDALYAFFPTRLPIFPAALNLFVTKWRK